MIDKTICFFTGFMAEGGAERVIAILGNYFVSNGWQVEIVTYYDDIYLYQIDERIKKVSVEKNTQSRNIVKNIMWIRRYFTEKQCVIISFLAIYNIMILVSLIGLHIPIVVADRNDPNYVPNKKWLRLLRNICYEYLADQVVLQTHHNKEYFSQKTQKKSSVIYNPINLGENKGKALTTKKENVIVAVGRLIKQKNYAMLMEAFHKIICTGEDYCLEIYGEGDERDYIEAFSKKNNLQGRVVLKGGKNDPIPLIGKAKLYVLTSKYEGMPNSLLEAMCLGIPVISTKVSGATDLIIHGVNGYLVDDGDVDGLANYMKLIINSDEIINRMGTEAAKVNEYVKLEKIAEQWEKLIIEVLNKNENRCY